jgi:hypothetical protein
MKSRGEIKSYIEELTTQGVPALTAAPPLHRMMWRFGINVPPPLSCNLEWYALVWAVVVGFVGCAVFSVVGVIGGDGTWVLIHLPVIWAGFDIIGVFMGCFIAAHCWWIKKKIRVPKW